MPYPPNRLHAQERYDQVVRDYNHGIKGDQIIRERHKENIRQVAEVGPADEHSCGSTHHHARSLNPLNYGADRMIQ